MKSNYSQKIILLSFLLSAVVNGSFISNDKKDANKKQTEKQYDIAAYVWPSYAPDDRAKIFWPMGIGEWETVMKNKPKFEGHQQPRYPLWGYVNESDPYVMQMEIDAAADHGINVFIYDWYWYDGMPFLEGSLNNGFLKAKNNYRMKFYLMWANHDVNMVWDKRNAGLPNKEIIWNGGVTRSEFEKVCNRIIKNYFNHPQYYKVNGKPSFMIYDLGELIRGLGSIEATCQAIDWFRQQTIKAGFPGLDLQLTLRNQVENLTGLDGESIGSMEQAVKQIGFDGLTHYQSISMTNMNRDYNEINADIYREWYRLDSIYKAPYYAHVSIGWDNNPRFEMLRNIIVKNNTPENFEKALIEAKKYTDAHPNQAPLITINSWNEWTETSYLQPCTMFGYGYLEAVKRVFGENVDIDKVDDKNYR